MRRTGWRPLSGPCRRPECHANSEGQGREDHVPGRSFRVEDGPCHVAEGVTRHHLPKGFTAGGGPIQNRRPPRSAAMPEVSALIWQHREARWRRLVLGSASGLVGVDRAGPEKLD
jgi:hypothetical protein